MPALLAFAVAMRGQAPTGALVGTVFDETGAVVPGGAVKVTSKQTGFVRSVTSGAGGMFSVTSLTAGPYEVKVEAKGFRTLVRDATVETGTVVTVDMHLEVGASSDVVTVEAAAPQIEYERHTIDGVVTRQQIQNLPLNGRSFLQLAFLEPGVTVSAYAQGQYNRAFDVSILGGDSGLTRITIDGANIRDAVNGGTEQNFSQEVVQEFQVSSVNFDLSTGLTAGGAVNVVTRTGSNDFHGSGFFFFRDHNLSAYPALQRDPMDSSPFFARRQTGFWLGGPVKKERLFFFTSYEHNNQRGVFSTLPNDPSLIAFANITTSPFNENLVGERLDYRISSKHTAFVRYSHDGNNSFAPHGIGLPSSWVVNTNWADSGVFSLISSFTPAAVNEFRYSMTFWHNSNAIPTEQQCPNCLGLDGPSVTIDGTNLNFGNQYNSPQSRVVRRHIFADNMNWQKGSHRTKFGGEWEWEKGTGTYVIDDPAAITLFSPAEVRQLAPQYLPLLPKTFTTLNDILKLPLESFSFGFGDPNQPPPFQAGQADHDNVFHFYWQDSWKLRPRLTVNYGLGYNYESNALNHDMVKPQWLEPFVGGPGGLGPETHAPFHFSPVLGFAWSPWNDDKTVIRGGAGIFYDTIDLTLRLIERNYIGPLGAGYVTLPGSLIANPLPGIPGVKTGQTLDFTSPTGFQGAYLFALLPQIRQQAMQLVPVNPNNKSLAVTTIDLFKTGTELFTRDFVPPSAQHFSLGAQRQVTSDFAISADFVYRHFIHLTQQDLDANHFYQYTNGVQTPLVRVCSSALQLVPGAPCSNGSVNFIYSGGNSTYKGLLVRADKRFSHRYQLQVAYALQSQIGVGSNGYYDLKNWNETYGPLLPRNNLNISGVVELPWKFQFCFISSFTSAPPFEPIIPGVDLTGSGVQGFPLPGMGQSLFDAGLGKGDLVRLVNQYNQTYAGKKGPNPAQTFPLITLPQNYNFGRSFNSQDIRVTKFLTFKERFKLDLFVEAFNLLNIANLSGYSTNLLDPAFGQPTTRASNIFGTGGPRAFQLGSRLSF